MAETSAHFPGRTDEPQHVGHSGRMQMQECNEDLRFLSACAAPAIILIWSCPEGAYYSIYFNSPGLLHFFRTGQRNVPSDQKNVLPAQPALHIVVVTRSLAELKLT